ncbi:MAG: protein kinase [Planctomycetaceae bacterium]|nr:protein kinase [Planctomycetaceae bacterium]MCB9953798.1 protein kinase [Planctomycetaceae bacterium]
MRSEPGADHSNEPKRREGGTQLPASQNSPRNLSGGAKGSSSAPDSPSILKNPHLQRYRIIRELGRGGMAIVYLAEDTELERTVAIKIPRLDSDPQSVGARRFRQEALAVGKLNHPNICRVYDFGTAEGVSFLVLEYVQGKGLCDYAHPEKLLPVKHVVQLIRKIALAVHTANQAGLVHRDLKPSNIILTAKIEGNRKLVEPKVMDFGLAKSLEANNGLTREGTILGTPQYMSKEQWSGSDESLTASSDVFSLGVILYELLTGQLPYDVPKKSAPTAWLSKLLSESPVPPTARRPDLEAELEVIVLKAISRDAASRYPDMAAFAEALDAWLSSRNLGGASASNDVEGDIDERGESAGNPISSSILSRLFTDSWNSRSPQNRLLSIGLVVAAVMLLAMVSWGIFRSDGKSNANELSQNAQLDRNSTDVPVVQNLVAPPEPILPVEEPTAQPGSDSIVAPKEDGVEPPPINLVPMDDGKNGVAPAAMPPKQVIERPVLNVAAREYHPVRYTFDEGLLPLDVRVEFMNLPLNATYDEESRTLSWRPTRGDGGKRIELTYGVTKDELLATLPRLVFDVKESYSPPDWVEPIPFLPADSEVTPVDLLTHVDRIAESAIPKGVFGPARYREVDVEVNSALRRPPLEGRVYVAKALRIFEAGQLRIDDYQLIQDSLESAQTLSGGRYLIAPYLRAWLLLAAGRPVASNEKPGAIDLVPECVAVLGRVNDGTPAELDLRAWELGRLLGIMEQEFPASKVDQVAQALDAAEESMKPWPDRWMVLLDGVNSVRATVEESIAQANADHEAAVAAQKNNIRLALASVTALDAANAPAIAALDKQKAADAAAIKMRVDAILKKLAPIDEDGMQMESDLKGILDQVGAEQANYALAEERAQVAENELTTANNNGDTVKAQSARQRLSQAQFDGEVARRSGQALASQAVRKKAQIEALLAKRRPLQLQFDALGVESKKLEEEYLRKLNEIEAEKHKIELELKQLQMPLAPPKRFVFQRNDFAPLKTDALWLYLRQTISRDAP